MYIFTIRLCACCLNQGLHFPQSELNRFWMQKIVGVMFLCNVLDRVLTKVLKRPRSTICLSLRW